MNDSEPIPFPTKTPHMTQAEFDEIRADASVICAALRVDIAQAQAELAKQDLRINQAAFQLMYTAPAPAPLDVE